MKGTAGIKGLQIDCIVGIFPHERKTPQTVILDIEIDYDFAAASGSDAIGDAVDYDAVARWVTDFVRRRGFQLLETMAEETAALVLGQWAFVQTVRLEIRKPAAVPSAAAAFVRVERSRG